ncbi:hypothetical protein SDC9_193691 [bioreactor metagenome]|uniref:Uncharacterized protein n=1 Tax=bioreactor metagenome TaxID=1076179 RepID=A0A645I4C2_9ZZZZ
MRVEQRIFGQVILQAVMRIIAVASIIGADVQPEMERIIGFEVVHLRRAIMSAGSMDVAFRYFYIRRTIGLRMIETTAV